MNTGIQDAHNIAWKLSSIIKQENGARVSSDHEEKRIDASNLLHSYESERMLIAILNNSLSIYNFVQQKFQKHLDWHRHTPIYFQNPWQHYL